MNETQNKQYDVAIVGAGIVGLANAWMAAQKGKSVIVLERSPKACGASVRNFGMIWPIGQPLGELFELAMRSREHWLKAASESNLWANECGSLHLVHHDDELAVIEEFLERADASLELQLLDREACAKKTQAANLNDLKGALWSPWELCVNPVEAVAQFPSWLNQQWNVQFLFETTAVSVSENRVITSCGREIKAEQIAVCSGADFETLFPKLYSEMGLAKCKLQMLATGPQPNHWKFGPHIAGGLTLRHYRSFADCPTLPNLKKRISETKPELDKFGIHVMASQNNQGEVILGDSHVYDDEITPFDSEAIDDLILHEIRALIDIPDMQIQRRWHGIYAKHPTNHVTVRDLGGGTESTPSIQQIT